MYLTTATLVSLFLSQISPATACPGHYRRDTNGTSNSTTPRSPGAATRIKPPTPTAKVALTNVRVFDGYRILDPSTVVIDGTHICNDTANIDTVVDGNGGVLLPGLFDSHTHADTTDMLETLSSYGVTTTLAMNCLSYEACSSLRYQTGLTSFFYAGLSAKGPNGAHAKNAMASVSETISVPEQAPQYVANVFGNGSDWLKVVAEQGGPDQATQNALVLNAHALGKKTMTHAADLASYLMAIESKTDGPQHIPLDGPLNSTVLAKMHQQQQYATPTMTVFNLMLRDPTSAATLGHGDVDFDKAWALIKRNVLALKDAGVPILAGTDATPPYAGLSVPFGSTLHDELGYLVEVGLSPAEALRAATITPAMAHYIHDRGEISSGKRADLVLLQPGADPLRNISDTRKIARVWNGGLEYLNVTAS